MSKVRQKNTPQEITVRKALWVLGFRYRTNVRTLPGSPDIVIKKYKAAIFVHGCFWHGHDCKLYSVPKSNSEFWLEKIAKNKARDLHKEKNLVDLGWNVLTVWQCELKKSFFVETINRVESQIKNFLLA